jgi:monofunctional biosynthetic peptidoglycan transglycosylase
MLGLKKLKKLWYELVMFFDRYQLKILLGIFSLSMSIGLSALYLYQDANLEILFRLYPKWNIEQQKFSLQKDQPKHWTKLDSLSKEVKWAFLVSEDWAFYDHEGLDFNQINKAVKQSIVELRFTRGASTISQQVIKNLFVGDERSLWRKFKEALYTLKLEKHFDKDEILEVYLNIAHLGKDVYGIGEASWHYFKKRPSQLNVREAAFLAMLLPSPEKYSHSFRKKELTPFAKSQIDEILIKLRQAKVFTEEDRLEATSLRFQWEKVQTETMEVIEDDYFDEMSL